MIFTFYFLNRNLHLATLYKIVRFIKWDYMALSNKIIRSNFLKYIHNSIRSNYFIKYVHNSDAHRTEIDAIDAFTTQLLQKKTDKWETIRVRRKLAEVKPTTTKTIKPNLEAENATIDIRNYDKDKLDQLLDENLDSYHGTKTIQLINQCVEYRICPSAAALHKIFSFCAQNGHRDAVISLQNLAQDHDPDLYDLNAQFNHYLAEATWVKGNVDEGLKLFEEVYANYTFLRRKLRLMIKYMVANVISDRSEASLVLITIFAEKIAQQYVDFFPLACVWQCCFISEWYADQIRASELLERYRGLCGQIVNRIPYVVQMALKNHQTEVVYRLFELLLKYQMKTHYTYVLQAIFNYKFLQNDLRSCAEIIQWSVNIDIPLDDVQHEQFISLLLNHDSLKKKPPTPQSFQLKF